MSPQVVTHDVEVDEPAHVAGGRVVISFIQYTLDGRVMHFSAVLETSEILRPACREERTMPEQGVVHLSARALPY